MEPRLLLGPPGSPTVGPPRVLFAPGTEQWRDGIVGLKGRDGMAMGKLGVGSTAAQWLIVAGTLVAGILAAPSLALGAFRGNVDAITVDVASTIRVADRRIVGLNTNYLTDHADIRSNGQGYENALKQLNVGSLRYPGGEEAEEILWSTGPFSA